jgi:nitronate monooxygenase
VSPLDLRVPVVQAPMAGVSGGALAAAVSAAGGLGCIAAGSTTSVSWLEEQVALLGGQRCGIGLLAWALPERSDLVEAVLAARPALVSMSYGPYERYVERFRDAGVLVATQAGTVEEAVAAERAGVDVLVARGGEGGGHGRDDVATLPLLQGVLDAVSVPVLAAGGIATARGVAAVLAAGAVGAWVGTAFLPCPEAMTTPEARERLLAAPLTGTAYGRVFDVGQRQAWPPEYGGRALRNAFFDRWQGRLDELAADDDAPGQLRDALRERDYDTAVLYAGQAVGLLGTARSAAEVVAELGRGVDLLVARAHDAADAARPDPRG